MDRGSCSESDRCNTPRHSRSYPHWDATATAFAYLRAGMSSFDPNHKCRRQAMTSDGLTCGEECWTSTLWFSKADESIWPSPLARAGAP